MATEERKFTPAEIKERRVRAAQETVDTAAKRLEKAEKRVTDAKALETKRDEAKAALNTAEAHLQWVRSMPVPGEAPAEDEGTDESEPVNPVQ